MLIQLRKYIRHNYSPLSCMVWYIILSTVVMSRIEPGPPNEESGSMLNHHVRGQVRLSTARTGSPVCNDSCVVSVHDGSASCLIFAVCGTGRRHVLICGLPFLLSCLCFSPLSLFANHLELLIILFQAFLLERSSCGIAFLLQSGNAHIQQPLKGALLGKVH